jgi:hypothetical protein
MLPLKVAELEVTTVAGMVVAVTAACADPTTHADSAVTQAAANAARVIRVCMFPPFGVVLGEFILVRRVQL